jgi:flagellar motor switch protein FliN/FliY
MPDMDENNEIKQQSSENDSEESPKDVSASADGQEPEPTPEEQEMMAMAEGSFSDEAAEESSAIPDGGAGADLLDQSEIDKVLKDAGVDEESNDAQIDASNDEFGGFADPEAKQADFQQLSSTPVESEMKNIELLMDVELPISIELGKTKMNISDILGLAPGSIVELDKLVGEPVDLLVNQRCVAKGEVVVVEENFGLRITQLVSPEERLRNLQ